MKKVYAKDLIQSEANTTFSSDFILSSVNIGKTKSGKEMIRLNIGDKTGSIASVIWETVGLPADLLKDATIVYVTGVINYYNGKVQATVSSIAPRSPYSADSDFEKATKFSIDEMWEKMSNYAWSFSNTQIGIVARSLMLDEKRSELFKRAPAATSMHHAFVGGLLEHTTQMLDMADSLLNLPFFKDLNRDLCMFGVMFHDFGKIYEYESSAGFKATEQGILVGHIAKTCALIEVEALTFKIDDRIRDNLQHVVLAHHGCLEYGSPVPMSTPEAVFVHHVDNLHGTVFGFLQKVENDARPGDLAVRHGYDGSKVLVKRFNDVIKEIEETK